MLCSSLNADSLVTCSSEFFSNFFSQINMSFVHLNLSKEIFVKFLPEKSCDKDDFHPSRDAALLYGPLDGLHGPHGLVFTEYSEVFWKNRQLHSQKQGIFVCLKLLLSVEMNTTSIPFSLCCLIPILTDDQLWGVEQFVYIFVDPSHGSKVFQLVALCNWKTLCSRPGMCSLRSVITSWVSWSRRIWRVPEETRLEEGLLFFILWLLQ